MTSLSKQLQIALFAPFLIVGAAQPLQAKTLTQGEIRSAMLGKPIYTSRFGMSIRMLYRSNGTVSAKAPLGSVNGTWRAKGNKICTTFPSGPAKGTSCVTYTKIGPDKYRTSDGVTFRVGG